MKGWKADWRAKVMEALIGGASGLAAVVIYIIARAIFDGAGPGDWLAFAGVILGVGFTIFGAKVLDIVLERSRIKRRHRELMQALRALEMGLEMATTEPAIRAHQIAIVLQGMWRSIVHVSSRIPEMDFERRSDFAILETLMEASLPRMVRDAENGKHHYDSLSYFRRHADDARVAVQYLIGKWERHD